MTQLAKFIYHKVHREVREQRFVCKQCIRVHRLTKTRFIRSSRALLSSPAAIIGGTLLIAITWRSHRISTLRRLVMLRRLLG